MVVNELRVIRQRPKSEKFRVANSNVCAFQPAGKCNVCEGRREKCVGMEECACSACYKFFLK